MRAVPLRASLDPEMPLPGDDTDHVGKILPAFPAAFLDRQQTHGCSRPDGVLDDGTTHASPRRYLGNGPVTVSLLPYLIRHDPQGRQLAYRELAGH